MCSIYRYLFLRRIYICIRKKENKKMRENLLDVCAFCAACPLCRFYSWCATKDAKISINIVRMPQSRLSSLAKHTLPATSSPHATSNNYY